MIFGAVLAGGLGSRMKTEGRPKQFFSLGDKPVLLHAVQKFIDNKRFDGIYIAIHSDWIPYFTDLLKQYQLDDPRLHIVSGGADRNATLMNVIEELQQAFGSRMEDVIVTHDAVRPFVTQRMLNEHIDGVLQYGACDTVIPATDTIVRSLDGLYVSSIPLRSELYQSQTPQSFPVQQLKELYQNLDSEQKSQLTDACKIFTLAGKKVRLIQGEVYNIKITTAADYQIAQAMLKQLS